MTLPSRAVWAVPARGGNPESVLRPEKVLLKRFRTGVRLPSAPPNKVDSFDTEVFETINLFLFAKILAAQGFSAKRHLGIVSLCALWITLLETATVHADNRITFRFKDGTDIEVGAE